ncbi:MAG TPA: hypothetical protein DEB39_16925 [Planctomycetaceae bacterium]|nr:hypothetical protein [Planctomycetaceae bacterium]
MKYVQPLRKGRTTAREVEPRQDVTDDVVDRTLHRYEYSFRLFRLALARIECNIAPVRPPRSYPPVRQCRLPWKHFETISACLFPRIASIDAKMVKTMDAPFRFSQKPM